MTLLTNWRDILKRAYSVKFNAAAIIFGGIEGAITYLTPECSVHGVFGIMATLSALGALASRFYAQKELSGKP